MRTLAVWNAWSHWRLGMTQLLLLLLLLFAAQHAANAQAQSNAVSPATGACWRVQFATWAPTLDWNRSGHAGDAKTVDQALRHVRDSVFDRDSVASGSNAMVWEKSTRGWNLMLYPSWWPAGVNISFDIMSRDSTDFSGDAVALVADGSRQGSRTRAHVWRVPCG